MSHNLAYEKYYLNNLDCASCAAKIEKGLKQVQGVSDATVDFATLTLHIKAENIHHVKQAIRGIDPDVEMVSADESFQSDRSVVETEGLDWRKEKVLLATAVILFSWLLFFEGWFQQGELGYLEIGVALAAYLLVGANVLKAAWRTLRNRIFFDENVLMVIATSGAFAIHAYTEAVGVMLFYKVGEMLQEMAVSKSRRSIRSLLQPNRTRRP